MLRTDAILLNPKGGTQCPATTPRLASFLTPLCALVPPFFPFCALLIRFSLRRRWPFAAAPGIVLTRSAAFLKPMVAAANRYRGLQSSVDRGAMEAYFSGADQVRICGWRLDIVSGRGDDVAATE